MSKSITRLVNVTFTNGKGLEQQGKMLSMGFDSVVLQHNLNGSTKISFAVTPKVHSAVVSTGAFGCAPENCDIAKIAREA